MSGDVLGEGGTGGVCTCVMGGLQDTPLYAVGRVVVGGVSCGRPHSHHYLGAPFPRLSQDGRIQLEVPGAWRAVPCTPAPPVPCREHTGVALIMAPKYICSE
jgi:hypothetical protein